MWNNGVYEEESECDFNAAALTALFDGEANPDEASRARLHLLTCARCAEMWTSWNRTRYLFQNIPVTAPPALLLRILMACRMAATNFRRSGAVRTLEQEVSSSNVEKTLPPSIDTPPLPPQFLKEEILRATTRATPTADYSTKSMTRSGLAAPRQTRPWLALGMRFAAATAVPASLLWISLISSPATFSPATTGAVPHSGAHAITTGTMSESARGETAGRGIGEQRNGDSPKKLSAPLRVARGVGRILLNHAISASQAVGAGNDARTIAAPPQSTSGDRESDFDAESSQAESDQESNDSGGQTREQSKPSGGFRSASFESSARSTSGSPFQLAALPLPASHGLKGAMAPANHATHIASRITTVRMRVASVVAERPRMTRSRLMPMPVAVSPQFASLSGMAPTARTLPAPSSHEAVSITTSADMSTDDTGAEDSDLRNSRPEAVSRVLDTFRAALLQDGADSNLAATES